LSDTIGFIRDLPPNLIEAFASTLEDSIESDILLHVIDSSDVKLDEKIRVVEDILASIGAKQKKLFVFNKIDLLSDEEIEVLKNKYSDINPIFVSSYKKIGFDDLKQAIISSLV
jgi:GTP-binding protein HflX